MKRTVLILIIVIAVIFISYQVYNNYLTREFKKYCIDNCDVNHVSKNDLENVKSSRKEIAVTNIQKYQDDIESINNNLVTADLTSDEQAKLNNTKLEEEYNQSIDYSIDELLQLETEYKQVDDSVQQVFNDYNERLSKESINEYLKQIEINKQDLENASLSSTEQEQYADLNEQLSSINYDKSKDYNMEQLDSYIKMYRNLAKQYNYLAKYN